MEIIRNSYNLKPRHQMCAVTIGNFDGLHLGHQALINKLKFEANALHLPTVAIIFEPQPNEYFSPTKPVARLMRFREKVAEFKQLGLDRILCIRFNEAIARQTAEDFVRVVLFEHLAAKYVLVGDDFKFGYQRLGDFSLLKQLSQRYHFRTECMDTFEMFGGRVSSTRIRTLLEQGDLEQAGILLGRSFALKGRIVHGDKRGRQLGFPTANIHLHRKQVPLSGVFAVEMLGLTADPLPGVANMGTRPTIGGGTRTLLEVHLLNFHQDIYGRQVEIRFLQKFRDEIRFADFEALKMQIGRDIAAAKTFFSHSI